jgi:phosphomannomutase
MTDGIEIAETLETLIERSEAWIAIDPQDATRDALRAMVLRARSSGDTSELAECMGDRLRFGTAGLRGTMGPGSNRLNCLMARQTAFGLADALLKHQPAAVSAGVLVGHDARHGSEEFAQEIIFVLTQAGVPCTLVPGPQPTPLVAWGLRHRGFGAAVVVTASHNPAKDNGIKIYWGDGAQIVPPVDGWIAEAIESVSSINPPGPLVVPTLADEQLTAEYVEMVVGLVGGPDPQRSDFRIAATAMHGVGAKLLRRCLSEAGFTSLSFVPSQEHPDPDFPTIPFPNPEEAGATDLLVALATETQAEIALATDPDADRLAVAIPDPPSGGFRLLTGDELGALLATGLLERRAGEGLLEGSAASDATAGSARRPLLVTTVVSSQLLHRIAEAAGTAFEETLTGFKWLCRPGFEHPEYDQVLAYEESIGYAVGGLCDKDGIAAAAVVCDLVRSWRAQGRSCRDVLDGIARQHGAHVTNNFSLRVSGVGWAERLQKLTKELIANPPKEIAGIAVGRIDQPAADVIRLFLVNGDRVVIRPSGTEPKLKCYCEAVEPIAANESAQAGVARAKERAALLRADLTTRLAV